MTLLAGTTLRGGGYAASRAYMGSTLVWVNGKTPAAPVNLTATRSNEQVALSWTAPSDNGSPITDYVVQYSGDGGKHWSSSSSSAITITQQPANATSVHGSASFSVTAIASKGATISYQWQRQIGGVGEFSNVNFIGNSSTLSLTSLDPVSENGDVYRCVVSATGGAPSVPSNGATLTVVPYDPMWTSVRLLVPYNNTDADLSASGVVPTGGNAAASFSTGKYAQAGSLLASGNQWRTYNITDIGVTQNFTAECWLALGDPNPTGGTRMLSSELFYLSGHWSSGQARLNLVLSNVSESVQPVNVPIYPAAPLELDRFYHVAITREWVSAPASYGRIRVYIDGAQVYQELVGQGALENVAIGYPVANTAVWPFRIDDLRVTAGLRYADGASFTPPTAAFPTN